ncbi:hypothetical protein M0208_16870 [Sphingomonas sp. SUN019]|uniref:hypothetical protein n=1 Tax=Sphingomonas sp. SUN019 TaxID=2937788 RepID=UPI002164EB98|nr:hypothetical protein [Sphingomonas sp. SUN019]UVO52100.1 hypothetical protein M0208_16870 [Sphingomonas sp. SUN019]
MTAREHLTFWRLLLAVAITVAIVMALLPTPPMVPASDKTQHMAAFGVLTVLSALAYPMARLYRIGERLSFLGAMIEVAQSIPALHRDCDILDWVADTSMIVAVLVVIALVRSRRAVAP